MHMHKLKGKVNIQITVEVNLKSVSGAMGIMGEGLNYRLQNNMNSLSNSDLFQEDIKWRLVENKGDIHNYAQMTRNIHYVTN